ncbi:homeobox-domain-containing protein [Phlegmacium glaucopus]|nr:homeobox-domain-containing protein [Phlegmacium glaucopus]
MSRPPLPLSRTSSSNSFSSEDDGASMSSSTVTVSSSRRTRKRFTNTQLTMLENLFHQNSHPSREDREAVAKAGGMEIKSVTIWFQNKRQTERKSAATSNTNNSGHSPSNAVPNITSTMHTFSLNGTSRTASPSLSTTSKSTSNAHRPSLDRVASRSELRVAAPRTPSRRHNPSGAIWENMPSSPIAPPLSPPPREFIDFGKNTRTRRTLEWACAAARVAEKDGHSTEMSSAGANTSSSTIKAGGGSRGRTIRREHNHTGNDNDRPRRECGDESAMDVDLTDEEDHEAITPPSTWGKGDLRWTPAEGGLASTLPKGVDDDDMFKAALALCGLGRRT